MRTGSFVLAFGEGTSSLRHRGRGLSALACRGFHTCSVEEGAVGGGWGFKCLQAPLCTHIRTKIWYLGHSNCTKSHLVSCHLVSCQIAVKDHCDACVTEQSGPVRFRCIQANSNLAKSQTGTSLCSTFRDPTLQTRQPPFPWESLNVKPCWRQHERDAKRQQLQLTTVPFTQQRDNDQCGCVRWPL